MKLTKYDINLLIQKLDDELEELRKGNWWAVAASQAQIVEIQSKLYNHLVEVLEEDPGE